MLVAKVPSPAYIAVMVCGSWRHRTGETTPGPPRRSPQESTACSTPSIVNVTMPVGMPVPVVGATIAVNVTA